MIVGGGAADDDDVPVADLVSATQTQPREFFFQLDVAERQKH